MKKPATLRQAFTLLEVIIVMAIIVIAASISVPWTINMLAEARIGASADVVRGRLAEARANAMEQGRPWRLGFLANSGVYQLAPDDAPVWDNVNQEPTEETDLIRGVLPKDVVFALTDTDISSSNSPSAGSKWETIGVYLAEGCGRDDTTTYFGKAGMVPMRIRLRSLTGNVVVETPSEVKASP